MGEDVGRRGRWSGRCPHCGGADTSWVGGALDCRGCQARVPGTDSTAGWKADSALDAGEPYRRAGGLEAWLDEAGAALEASIAENLRRIDAMWAARQGLRRLVKATKCTVWGTVLRWLAVEAENARARRGGREEDVVHPHRERSTSFSGYRHAMAVATCGTGVVLGGAGALRMGGAAAARHALPQGLVLGQMAVAPSRSGSSRARGEDALIDQVDLAACVHRTDVSPLDMELLSLVDVGRARRTARRGAHGIEPAVEELRVDDALAELRRRHPRRLDLPATVHQARLRIRRARTTIQDALHRGGHIPAPMRRRARAASVEVEVPASPAVARINPLDGFL